MTTALALVLGIVCGCDGPPDASDAGADVGADGGADGSGPTIAPPAPAAPPVLTPCPDGWTTTADDPPACEPWPFDAPPACTGANARFPSTPDCAPLGTPCPADGWPVDAPADALFVRAGAAAGGDGSRTLPFATVAEALAVAAPGRTVAVAVGAYEGAVDVPAGVTLLGACVESTVLSADAARYDRGVITVTGSDVVIRNLRVAESEQAGLWIAGADRSATVRDVLIEDVLVAGVDVEQGATLDAERLVVRRPRATALGTFGRGLTIETGAHAEFRQLVVEAAVELGVVGILADTRLSLDDVAISGTTPIPSEIAAGGGLLSIDDAEVVATRIVVEGNTTVGVGAQAGTVTVRDGLIRGTRPRPIEGDLGRGAEAQRGGTVVLERVSLAGNHGAAALAIGEGSRVTLTDGVIRGSTAEHGWGFGAQELAMVEGERVHVAETREVAIVVGNILPAYADFTDLTIVDTQLGGATLAQGRAISVQRGGFTATRVDIQRSIGEAVVVSGMSEATLTDLVIRDVALVTNGIQPRGRGLFAMIGGRASIERAVISGTVEAAIAAMSAEAHVEARDVSIGPTPSVECDAPTCAPGGHGVFAYFGATVELHRFHIMDPEVCGVHVAEHGTATLTDGIVSGAAIGACVQSTEQQLESLQQDVLYVDNDTPLDATMLPVPAPPDTL